MEERLQGELEMLGANFAVLERVIAALIATHPDPGALACLIREFERDAQVQQAFAPGITPETRAEAKKTAERLLDIAELTQQQRGTLGKG